MDDLSSMTVVELKKELRSRSLKISGKKADLIVRLRAAIDEEESETETNNNNNNDSNDNTNDNTNTNSFADFEEYINDEYNRLNNKESHVDDTNNNQIDNIDELLNTNQNTKDDTDIKDEQEQKDIILNTNTPGDNNNNNNKPIILSDFNVSEDPNALNNKSKIEDRRNRFGTQNNNDLSKIESRKRRFNHNNNSNNNNIISTPPTKKPRVDMEAERNKVFERAQKYGTSLPKGFKLTADESKVMYADKIERAKRFGTQHLLPTQLKKAEENIKKEERKKRFKIDDDVNNNNNNNNNNENIAVKKTESKPVNIIGVKVDRNSTKLMERKLRFGNGIAVEDGNKSMNNNKKFNNRQFRNNEKFKQFRAYKKNNKNNRNNRGGGRGRGRGRGRGYGGNRRGRGTGRGGGYRNNNNNNNAYDNGVFSAEDLEKINQRKMRFNSL